MAAKDEYGLRTAIGTGRRLGRVALEQAMGRARQLNGKLRVMFWILQDRRNYAEKQVEWLLSDSESAIDATIMPISGAEVGRCIACDICPTHVGPDAEYRCIIKKKKDIFIDLHERLLDYDLIVPVALSPKDRSGLVTKYQRFIERTRYIRRGDYLFTDVAVMPLIFEEVGAGENMNIRMLTSLIRHHTAVIKPNVAYIFRGEVLNRPEVMANWKVALGQAKSIAAGRLAAISRHAEAISYKPVGYVLSAAKDRELSVAERRRTLHEDRQARQVADANTRLGGGSDNSH
jgi:hypothetical protein